MKRSSTWNRLLSVFLVLAMLLSLAAPAMAVETGTIKVTKVDNSSIANPYNNRQTADMSEEEAPYADEDVVRVSIFLEKAATIEAGYAPANIAANSAAMAYRAGLKTEQEVLAQKIQRAIGEKLDVVWNLTLAANLISANVKYGQIKQIEAVKGVEKVVIENQYEPEVADKNAAAPNMDISCGQIGSDVAWAAGYTGAGSKVAIIDTGLDVLHEAFDPDAFEYSLAQLDGEYDLMSAADVSAVLSELHIAQLGVTADELYANSKVPFAFSYIDGDLDVSHYNSEHGSHVAGISAANAYIKDGQGFVAALETTYVQGVAPDAQILVMQVFGDNGSPYDADYMAAIEDAIVLGADSVNLSLGSGNPGMSRNADFQDILDGLTKSGVVVVMSAGNSGAWYDAAQNGVPYLYLDDVSMHTGGSPGTYTNSLCVASVDNAIAMNGNYYNMSDFTSWGVPGSLEMKPEITAPGGYIWSVAGDVPGYITGHDRYEYMSGTSMAAPQVAGMVAVLTQYFRESGLVAKTGKDARVLAQSLLMSTAEPIMDGDNNGYYYSVLRQGAGLGNVGNAVSAGSYILMDKYATASYADGKVKAELGDDPNRYGMKTFSFTINNITNEAQEFELSADVFTQGILEFEDILYMDKLTAPLNAVVTWKVNGEPLVIDGSNTEWDFDGDDIVTEADGQAILDYVVGKRDALHNAAKADLNGDDEVTSYDAYLFFTNADYEDVVVAPMGSVEVEVTIRLTDEEKAHLNQYYTNGAYIEGYVYAESSDGTSHSIPVLGFYGNWSDASMFDKGSYIEYLHGMETRDPYLMSNLDANILNGYTVVYANDPYYAYYFGGNPIETDETYMPERNAINSGDMIYSLDFAQIRNAGETLFYLKDTTNNKYVFAEEFGDVPSAFYYTNAGVWQLENNGLTIELILEKEGIAEGTALELGLTMIPEYYLDKNGNYNLDRLGKGATLSVPFVVDNTAPVIKGDTVRLTDDKKELHVTVEENQYVAGVVLYDANGKMLVLTGSNAEAKAGETLDYVLDVSELAPGDTFFLQAFDYAMNVSTYQLEMDIGSYTDRIDSVELTATELTMYKGAYFGLDAEVRPLNANNRNVVWSSTNEAVVRVVSQDGVFEAVGGGVAEVIATSAADPTKTGKCKVTVEVVNSTVYGVLTDASGDTVFYNWNLATDSTWTAGEEIDSVMISGTADLYSNKIYLMDANSLAIHIMDANTGAVEETAANAIGVPLYDMEFSDCFSSANDPRVHGIYGYYYLPCKDPSDLDASAFNLSTYLGKYTGAYAFAAVATYGYEIYENTATEHILLLDDAGYIWDLWVHPTSNGYNAFFDYAPTQLPVYGEYSGCSMIVGEDGRIYVSLSDGSNNELYLLKWNAKDAIYDAELVGNFEAAPAILLNVAANGTAAQNEFCARPADAGNHMTMSTVELTAEAIAEAAKADSGVTKGGLNSVSNYQAPQNTAETNGEDSYNVGIMALDGEGNEVDSTNGLITVTYDPSVLKLKNMVVNGDYTAVKVEDGSVTFAYVHLNSLAAGVYFAEFEFERLSDAETKIVVTHKECNDEQINFGEEYILKSTAPQFKWHSASATLGGNIGLNFYAFVSDEILNNKDAYVLFTFANETVKVPVSEAVAAVRNGDEVYRFTCPVTSKNMTDEVTAQLMEGNTAISNAVSKSVKSLAAFLIRTYKDSDPELVDLMKAMLNYGAAAQVLFNYKTDNLANADLSDADKALGDADASAYAYVKAGSEDGIALDQATLWLDTNTNIRIYFKLTGNKTIDQYTFTIDGKEVTPVQKGNQYYIESESVGAHNLDKMFTFAVGGLSVKFCALSWANMALNNPNADEARVNVAKALCAYSAAAEAYIQ